MRTALALVSAGIVLATAQGCAADAAPSLDDQLRLDQLQARGTHNSYHDYEDTPSVAEWRYRHAPLDVQLGAQGLRQLELDVHLMRTSDALEVFHLPLVDEVSTCRRFADCLEQVRAWSADHPRHVPILIFIEPKDDLARAAAQVGDEGAVDEVVLTGHLDRIDQDIRTAFPPAQLLTPDELQGRHASIRARLDAEGWPTLGEVRGRVMFVLLDRGELFDEYTAGGTTLAGRAMFAMGSPAEDWAAFDKLDDPVGDAAAIADALAAHIIVGTRADTDLVGDPPRAAAARASGAHYISTDVPTADDAGGDPFELGGPHVVRCNPVSGPPLCVDEDVEGPLGGAR